MTLTASSVDRCPLCSEVLVVKTQGPTRNFLHHWWGKSKVETGPASEHRSVLECPTCGVQWLYVRRLEPFTRLDKERKERATRLLRESVAT